MRVQFTAADIAEQMRVKTAFDPDWRPNPAKVFPLEGVESSDRSLRLGFGSHPQDEGRRKRERC